MAKLPEGLIHKLLQEVNPFGIIENGAYNRYTTQVDAYQDLFMILWNYFPRGWVDIPLFMCTFQGVNYVDAQRKCTLVDVMQIPIADIESNYRYDAFKELCLKLLKVTDCTFNENAFMQGLQKFNLVMMSETIQAKYQERSANKFTEKYYEPNYRNALGDSEQQPSEHSAEPEK